MDGERRMYVVLPTYPSCLSRTTSAHAAVARKYERGLFILFAYAQRTYVREYSTVCLRVGRCASFISATTLMIPTEDALFVVE